MELVAAAFAARAYHHVRVACEDRRYHRWDIFRLVRAIRVDENDDFARGLVQRHSERLAFAFSVVQRHSGAVLHGNFARPISRMAVDHKDLVCVRTYRFNDFADQTLFVSGRNDNGDSGCGHFSTSRGPAVKRPNYSTIARIVLTKEIGLGTAILGANLRSPDLPYKVTFVATYHCNFRCEMCNIWQKKSVNEMTPAEVQQFFQRWPQFRWVHLTGGELFMRRDLDDLVASIQASCRSLYLLNFPTTGWFGDKTVDLVEKTLKRGVGRLMVTISMDGPKALHEEMRGLPGSWDKAIETYRRLRGIKRSNFQTVIGMTLMEKNATKVDETIAAIQQVIPEFTRHDLHLNIGHESGHYFANLGIRRRVAVSREGD